MPFRTQTGRVEAPKRRVWHEAGYIRGAFSLNGRTYGMAGNHVWTLLSCAGSERGSVVFA